MDGYRWAPYLAVFYGRKENSLQFLCRYRWSWRILRIAFRFSRGPSGNVFQLPDMTIRDGVFQSAERGAEFALSLF
jgi:hypothetical protein